MRVNQAHFLSKIQESTLLNRPAYFLLSDRLVSDDSHVVASPLKREVFKAIYLKLDPSLPMNEKFGGATWFLAMDEMKVAPQESNLSS